MDEPKLICFVQLHFNPTRFPAHLALFGMIWEGLSLSVRDRLAEAAPRGLQVLGGNSSRENHGWSSKEKRTVRNGTLSERTAGDKGDTDSRNTHPEGKGKSAGETPRNHR